MKLNCLFISVLASAALIIPFPGTSQTLFTQVPAAQSGVNFQNKIVESPEHNVLAYEYFYNGGGVAVGDLNNDGLPDIVFTGNMEEPRIYLNKGHLHFEDITKSSKVRASGWKTGVTLADVDGDGWLDIFICRSGNGDLSERTNLLFINQHDGTFKEESEKFGLNQPGNSTQAVFFDYDHDGDLDLFLLRHSIKRLKGFDVTYMKNARDSIAGDQLFRNDGGHFTNVTSQAGIISNPICFGLGVAVADFDGDGWDDLYVTNDYDEDDYLYINQHDGTFKESLKEFMGHTSKYSMGCDVADVNNDGLPDLLTLDMLPEDNRRQKMLKGPDGYDHFQNLIGHGYYYQYMRNMLHLGGNYNGKIRYSEVGQLEGISNTDWSWSALFADFDLDGYQDLFISNGYMRDYTNMDFLEFTAPAAIRQAFQAGQKPDLYEMVKKMPSSEVKSYLFKNQNGQSFQNVTQQWGMGLPSLSNGAAYADFDNDGDWDLVVNNINEPAFIWQNHAEDLKNHYLKIRFDGSGKNRFGIGAKVLVEAPDGFKQVQELTGVHGFQSYSEPCLIFGLGKRDAVKVTVTWTSGKRQVLENQAVNKTLVLKEDDANLPPAQNNSPDPNAHFAEIPASNIPFTHQENDYNDFKREPLLPRQYSRNGPALASADVNRDGKPDLYVGGGKGQPGALLINLGDGRFVQRQSPALDSDAQFEGVEAMFADLNGDGAPDLYVVSGGNESNFQDHIYWNDGTGEFHGRPGVLPVTESSGGQVVALDIDGDGALDIFRAGQVTTGAYPKAPRSYLFHNDHGKFTDITPDVLKNIGMVCAVKVADINKDGIPDLILAGEFMPVTILYGQRTAPYFSADKMKVIPNSSGWWNCLKVEDINGDGNFDIIAGNEGLNGQMKPTPGQPVAIDAADLDNNGTLDAILSYYIQGKSYPVATRDELLDQMPSFKTKFPSYQSYCDATVQDIFNPVPLSSALHLEAKEFRSGVFVNEGDSFHFVPFPMAAQAFPVRDLITGYFRGQNSGPKDILLVGNNYAVRAQWGRQDAGKGLLLAQSSSADNSNDAGPASGPGAVSVSGAGPGPIARLPAFSVIPGAAGFYASKDARRMVQIGQYIIIANNNDSLQEFQVH